MLRTKRRIVGFLLNKFKRKVFLETRLYTNILGEKNEISTWYVEINSLEDLLALKKEVNNDLVVGNDEIIIYDGYLE